MPAPAVVLAFANDWSDDKRHLRNLLTESKAIAEALAPLVESGLVVVPPLHNATVDDVIGAFRARHHRGRIRIFHFGGHASADTLLFEDQAGEPSQAHATGLAGFLCRQRGLVLVFLNGCCTEPQVRALRHAGVNAVVATTRAIDDGIAAEFSRAFYAELCARPLRDAFDTTVQAMRTRHGDDPQGVRRDIGGEASGPPGWPWILDCDRAVDRWTLAAEVAKARRRTWRAQLLVAVGVMSLITSLAVSADVKRTACRVPGLRSLCAAAALGNVPSAAEQARWKDALAHHTRSALQAYLTQFPDGAYAEPAKARLAGCKSEIAVTLGPEKTIRERWPVNPRRAHPLPNEDAARKHAIDRGNEDARGYCEDYRRTGEVISAQVEPRIWECLTLEDGVTCGFEGDIVCGVRDRIRSDDDICH